jgi:ribosomal protein L40E
MDLLLDYPLFSSFVVIVLIIVMFKVASLSFGAAGRSRKTRVCGKCGTGLPRNASYCRHCGTKLDS